MRPAPRTEMPDEPRRDWHNFKSILPYLLEFKARMAWALFFLICAKLANVGVPVLLKAIVDGLENSTEQLLVLPVILLLGYGLLRLSSSLFTELRDTIFSRVRFNAMRRLSLRILDHLHRLSLRYHLERKTGAISRDLERGTQSISTVTNFIVISIVPTLIEFSLIVLILLGNYAISFTVVALVAVLVYFTFTMKVTEWRIDHRHSKNRLDSEANNHAVDSLINYETVKYFNNESLELDRYDGTLSEWEDLAVKTQSSMSLLNFGQGAIISLAVTVIMFLGADGVIDGSMTIGDLVMLNAFLLQLFIPLGALGFIYRQIKYNLADMDRVFRLLEIAPEIQDKVDAQTLDIKKGTLQFENVHFAYQSERKIIKGLSFTVPASSTVAIVGASGAGKSTLSRLIFRFYEPQEGKISIDGTDIQSVTQQSLRRQIGIVPQDTVLFNDTLRNNLQYGDPDADDATLKKAAEMAQLTQFIEQLPDGWETTVGERGLKLSGGEKQRVAIARALLKAPSILILDEATSSLDSVTEKAIQDTLLAVSQHQTTLVIAHRLSTVVQADQIIVLDNGEIAESGTHTELIAQNGLYKTLWDLQKNAVN